MKLKDKKIGIWGYGIVGKSLIKYLLSKETFLSVIDKKEFTQDEIDFFNKYNIKYYQQDLQLDNFFNDNDFIIPSPGVDLRPYKNFEKKWFCELDLFFLNFKKPIIAITGTIGKTTTTHFIEQILQNQGKNFIAAGNIGLGMCDLIDSQESIDGVILEVSSFQLEYCKYFAPTFCIWTNFFSNHLDRHDGLESYFQAKTKIFKYQNNNNFALLPLEISQKNVTLSTKVNYFSSNKPTNDQFKKINYENVFFVENNQIVKLDKIGKAESIINLEVIPKISFIENWIAICAFLNLKNYNLNFDEVNLKLPEHRFEKFITINNVDFFNDSKATIPDATLAAISKLQGKSVILFLGGISKGIDRMSMIMELKDKVKYIICFGKESELLNNLCSINNIDSSAFNNLQDAVSFCFKIMKPYDQVLFSPSGASFDLFSNYYERGRIFKNLVCNAVNMM